jgi:hypothetical protein
MPEEKTGYSRNPDYESVTTGRQNNKLYTSKKGGFVSALNDHSPGQTIAVDADETLSNGSISIPSDITIEGAGGTLTASADTGSVFLLDSGATNVTFDGLTVDSGGEFGSADTGCITGPNGLMGGLAEITVRGCDFTNFEGDGVKLVEQGGNTIEDVTVTNNRLGAGANTSVGHGALVGVKTDSAGVVKNVSMTDNTVIGAGSIGLTAFAFNGAVAENVTINDNRIVEDTGAYDSGIAFEGAIRNSTIGDNTVRTGNDGILLTGTGGGDNTVSGNAIDVAQKGIGVAVGGSGQNDEKESITGNVVAGGFQGIDIRHSGNDIVVGDCVVYGTSDIGINIEGAKDAKVSNCHVEGTGDFGIRARPDETTITGCTVVSSDRAGVNVIGDGCTITGGVYKDNDQQGDDNAVAAGIYLNGCTDVSVVGIRATDTGGGTQDYGVSGSSADFCSVSGCTLRGNATAATNSLGANSVTAGNVT